MKIKVRLRQDRANSGVLTIYYKDLKVCEFPCLGKADTRKATYHNNPSRDPTKPWGDTPTGRYGPTEIVWFDDHIKGIGEAAIPLPLEGAQGPQAEAARANGRSGLYIHAGRGSGRLRPSYGCLRLRFNDFIRVLNLLAGHKFNVIIEEEP